MKYRMYVDEVGDASTGATIANENHRYLSLTGIMIRLDYVQEVVHPELEQLKREFFGRHPDDLVYLHRKELVNKKPPFHVLRDVETLRRFDKAMLEHLQRWDYTVISVCIDKHRHIQQYGGWAYEPYHYCLACLLERYCYFLNRRQVKGDVLAESRGGKEDRALKGEYTRLWDCGTHHTRGTDLRRALTSRQLKIKTKASNIAGLQIADLLAHPSRCEILNENGCFEKELGAFAERMIAVLGSKYDRSGTRVWGKKLLGA